MFGRLLGRLGREDLGGNDGSHIDVYPCYIRIVISRVVSGASIDKRARKIATLPLSFIRSYCFTL